MKTKLPFNHSPPPPCLVCTSSRPPLLFSTLSNKYFSQQVRTNHHRLVNRIIFSTSEHYKDQKRGETQTQIEIQTKKGQWLGQYMYFQTIRKIIKNAVLSNTNRNQPQLVHFQGKIFDITKRRGHHLKVLASKYERMRFFAKLNLKLNSQENESDILLPRLPFTKILKALQPSQTTIKQAQTTRNEMQRLTSHIGQMIKKIDKGSSKKNISKSRKTNIKNKTKEKGKKDIEMNGMTIEGISEIPRENPEEKDKCHQNYGLESHINRKKKPNKYKISVRTDHPSFYSPLSLPQTPILHCLTSSSQINSHKSIKYNRLNPPSYHPQQIKSHPISPGTRKSSRPGTNTSRSHHSSCSSKSRHLF